MTHIYRQHVGGTRRHVGRAMYYCGVLAGHLTCSVPPEQATCPGCLEAYERDGRQLVLYAGRAA